MLASLAAFAGQAAVVYKWTDSDGVIHYSDQPVPGAEKIFTASGPSPGGTASSARSANPASSGPPEKRTAPGLNYTQFSITSPAPDQTFFGDDVISVHLTLDPGLKPEHTITWHLNGKASRRSGTDRDAIQPAPPGSRHLRHRRDHHGSDDRRILEHRQRQLLRPPAVRVVASAPETLANPFRRPDALIGR